MSLPAHWNTNNMGIWACIPTPVAMQYFVADQQVSLVNILKAKFLGIPLFKMSCPAAKQILSLIHGQKDRWMCEEIQIYPLSGDC